MKKPRFLKIFIPVLAALLTLFAIGLVYAAPTFSDSQANNPQVAGSPGSNNTAVFPTNKQNEPSIAVNPVNSSLLIAGSNDEQEQPPCGPGPVRGATAPANDCSFFDGVGTSGIYTSADGGKTWINRGLLDDQAGWKASPFVSDGDPVIVYGPKPGANGFSFKNGVRAYYATLASYKPGQNPFSANKVPELLAVSYSDDNGITWSAPNAVLIKDNPNNFNDKEAIWADKNPASPFFGRVYVSWTQFRSASFSEPSEPVMFVYSTDGGNSYSTPNQLSPASNHNGMGRQGSTVRSGPDGTVYVAWSQADGQVIAVSNNGGSTFSNATVIAKVNGFPDPIPGANFRTDNFLSLGVDPRSKSSTLFAAWADSSNGLGLIYVAKSTDKGTTWSAPQAVSTPAEGFAFFQGLDVAPNGRVDLAYQALVALNPATFGTGNAAINSWFTSNSGNGWTAPVKVSSASSDPAASSQNNLARQFYGDYNTLVSDNTHAWFIYTDTRTGSGCAAVDQYQQYLRSSGAAIPDDEQDELSQRRGNSPKITSGTVTKPAPENSCASNFGDSNVFVSLVTP